MRIKALFPVLIVMSAVGVAALLSEPTPSAASRPATSAKAVTSTADNGAGSLRTTIRGAKPDDVISLSTGRIVNKTDLLLDVPGMSLIGTTSTRSQIGGRQTAITASEVTLRDLEFFGEPDANGRSLLIIGKQDFVENVTIENVIVHAGGDDGAGCWGKFRNIHFRDCTFMSDTFKPCQKALVLGADSGTAQPDVGADEGYAATFTRCKLLGCYGNPRCSGGVYVFKDCDINVTSLGGAILMGARVNFIDCRFKTFDKPRDAPFWYRADVGPAPIVISGRGPKGGERNDKPEPNSVYIRGCSINGRPATAAELCSLSSPKGYAGVGSVPENVFRKEPW